LKYFPKFSSSGFRFQVLHLGLWSILRWLCTWWDIGVYFHSSAYTVFPAPPIKRLSFVQCMFLTPWQKISNLHCRHVNLFLSTQFWSTGLCVWFHVSTMLFCLL
jgi:hypothetical protein